MLVTVLPGECTGVAMSRIWRKLLLMLSRNILAILIEKRKINFKIFQVELIWNITLRRSPCCKLAEACTWAADRGMWPDRAMVNENEIAIGRIFAVRSFVDYEMTWMPSEKPVHSGWDRSGSEAGTAIWSSEFATVNKHNTTTDNVKNIPRTNQRVRKRDSGCTGWFRQSE